MAGRAEVTPCVLDTSVVVKWFSGRREPDLDCALRLRDEILAGSRTVAVPDLLFYELANALRFNRNLAPEDVREAVGSVFQMGFDVRAADRELLGQAVELGHAHDITVYDAAFLALAEREHQQLVTADHRFFARVKALDCVARLADVSCGPA